MSNETIIKKHSRRRGFGVAIVAAALVGSMLSAAPASAAIVSPLGKFEAGTTTPLFGLGITGYDTKNVLISLTVDVGTISLATTDGLTLGFGYSSFTGSDLLFSGSNVSVRNALSSARYTSPKGTQNAKIKMMATEQKEGLTYLAATRHFYKYVASPSITATAAKTAAEASIELGLTGYLASVTSSTENEFIIGKLQGSNGVAATNVWIGGNDSATEGTFKWTAGPENAKTFYTGCETSTSARTGSTSTFASWADGEPNNAIASAPYTPCTSSSTDFEGCITTNWRPSWAPNNALGLWNDLSCTSVNSQVKGYLVEYGDLAEGGNFVGVDLAEFNLKAQITPPAPAKPTFLQKLFSILRFKAAPRKKAIQTVTYGLKLDAVGTYRFQLQDEDSRPVWVFPGTVFGNFRIERPQAAITFKLTARDVNKILSAKIKLSQYEWLRTKYLVVTRLDYSVPGQVTQVRQRSLAKTVRAVS